MKPLSAFPWILLSLVLISSCKEEHIYRNENGIFGTMYHITYTATRDLQPEIDQKLADFDRSLSMFNSQSTLSRFNRWDTRPFPLNNDPWMRCVVGKSIDISRLTHGAFDITVAPLVNLWGFGWKSRITPSEKEIDSLRSMVGYTFLQLRGDSLVKTDPRVQLDASAVAKGYACDVIADLLRRKGVRHFLIEIGGEMVLSGRNPEGNRWRVGISKPIDDSTASGTEWEQRLSLTDKAIATSGNYRNYYVRDGKKYAHTIDPATGRPVQHSLLSATIVANDCLTADALATACMVMGVDSALALTERLPGVEGFFICDQGNGTHRLAFTSGMPRYLLDPPPKKSR